MGVKIEIKYSKDHEYSIYMNGTEKIAKMLVEENTRTNSYEMKTQRDKDNLIKAIVLEGDRIKNVFFKKLNY